MLYLMDVPISVLIVGLIFGAIGGAVKITRKNISFVPKSYFIITNDEGKAIGKRPTNMLGRIRNYFSKDYQASYTNWRSVVELFNSALSGMVANLLFDFEVPIQIVVIIAMGYGGSDILSKILDSFLKKNKNEVLDYADVDDDIIEFDEKNKKEKNR